MSSEPAPTRRPIAGLRMNTVALLGIVAAVTVPAGAADLVITGSVDSQQMQQTLSQVGPITRVVVEDADSSVRITGDATQSGVSGHASLSWHSFGSVNDSGVGVTQQYANGVLTLTKDCGRIGDCGADIDIRVPPTVSVQVVTSNAGITVSDLSGTVDLRTANASISATRLGGGDATMNTSDGPIRATFTGGPTNIWAHTSNAGVTIVTDGQTVYFDQVVNSNADRNLQNKQSRHSTKTIDVETSNAGVTIT